MDENMIKILTQKKRTKRDLIRLLKDFKQFQEIQKSKNLSIEQIGEILDQMRTVTFSAGQIIFHEGQFDQTFYFILYG